MRVFVLGGDGFCCWPTVLRLSNSVHDVTIVDNFSRREIDRDLGMQGLRVWFKTISGFSCPCEMSGDASDVCDGDPGRRACDGFFPVF